MFFFLMHLFFPFAFVFLLCTVPLFLAAFIVYYKKFRFRKLPDGHRDLKCETKNTPKLKKPHISPQMSRRRNFRAKLEDPVPNEHKPMIESSSPMKHFLSPDESLDQDDHDFISRNETIIEESLNELNNEKNSKNNPQEDYADNKEDEDVKARDKITNRIVGWNEDDSKNLMDLGLSETERNQRLENLIARRRARKFLMAIRGQASVLYENELETVRKMAPVKTDNIPSSSDEDPVPGSAPSVLLPTRNPFDIPYDPTEEKPNLMVDGFQQEFLGAHQITRHESFTLGTSFEIDKDRDSMRPAQRRYMDRVVNRESRFARLRRHPGDPDTLIEKLGFEQQYPDEEESCSSANKDEQEPELSAQQQDTENTCDEQLHARKSQQASSSSDVVENQRQKPEQEISNSSDKLLDSSSSSPIDLQSSDGEVEMEKESINFESREETPHHPPQINNTMQVEEEVMKQQEPEVIEIGPSGSSMGGEDKSSVSVGNIEDDEDEGGVLATQSHSNEECRDSRQRSCESLDQLVDIPQEEEESIFFVDNSHSMPPLSPEQASEDSRPTLLDNPEEIDNQQPPVEDLIPDTRKYNDEEYINPFANSVEEVDVTETNNANGDEKFSREGDDIKEETPPVQLKSEPLDILESRGVESQPSSEESQAKSREPPIEQLISEPIDQVSQSGVSHAPTDEQVNTKSGIV